MKSNPLKLEGKVLWTGSLEVVKLDERTKACRIIDQWYLAMREFLYAIR